jgi:hypothetical protein
VASVQGRIEVKTAVKVDRTMYELLEAYAQLTKTSVTGVVADALFTYLDTVGRSQAERLVEGNVVNIEEHRERVLMVN